MHAIGCGSHAAGATGSKAIRAIPFRTGAARIRQTPVSLSPFRQYFEKKLVFSKRTCYDIVL